MGMFDNVHIEKSLLPLTEDEKTEVGAWQTKDFDCVMTTYYINSEGRLSVDTSNFLDKEENIQPLNLTGSFSFYDLGSNQEWFEFIAFFENGQMSSIKRVLSS